MGAQWLNRRARSGVTAYAVLFVAFTATARADDATGTWTGQVEGVGNYYWERSTRVVVPSFGAKLVAPNGVGVDVNYLVDVISSASIAAGASSDAVFTELRHGIGLGVGKEFETGNTPLDLRVHGTYSTEDDYQSLSYGLSAALSLVERTTVLRLSLDRLNDDIESNANPMQHEQMDGIGVATRWEQVLSRTLSLSTGYTLGYLNGFTGNIYRKANVGPLPFAEDHPPERWRHTADARLRWFIPASATAIHVMPRGYLDSWDILALNPELRVYQELGTPDVMLRLRYRFYAQTAAEFSPEKVSERLGVPEPANGNYPQAYLDSTKNPASHVTGDPKMTAFQTHYAGIKFDFKLSFLDDSFLAFASPGWLYINFDRIWNTTRYGNGIITQVGGILPF